MISKRSDNDLLFNLSLTALSGSVFSGCVKACKDTCDVSDIIVVMQICNVLVPPFMYCSIHLMQLLHTVSLNLIIA